MKFFAKKLIDELKQYNEVKMQLVGKVNLNEWNSVQTPQIFIEDYEIEDGTFGF